MLDLLFAAALGASLVAISTVAAARWGHVIGGVLGAFPLIVGPVLLVAAERHGTAFAWLAAAALGALAGRVEAGLLGGLASATGSLAVARPCSYRQGSGGRSPPELSSVPRRWRARARWP